MIPLRFSGFTIFQPTRPLRGATGGQGGILSLSPYFNPRAPCGARPDVERKPRLDAMISTHAPLAGRDCRPQPLLSPPFSYFNPRAPCGARQGDHPCPPQRAGFQPTRPLRGATAEIAYENEYGKISTHAPLAGRDRYSCVITPFIINFNPRAPCGARRGRATAALDLRYFNPRAPCGARRSSVRGSPLGSAFQPTRPLRGATGDHLRPQDGEPISTHAPLAGRDTDASMSPVPAPISTHAPLAGRDSIIASLVLVMRISTHAPLAGRDTRHIQRLARTFYFNPRAPCGARQ